MKYLFLPLEGQLDLVPLNEDDGSKKADIRFMAHYQGKFWWAYLQPDYKQNSRWFKVPYLSGPIWMGEDCTFRDVDKWEVVQGWRKSPNVPANDRDFMTWIDYFDQVMEQDFERYQTDSFQGLMNTIVENGQEQELVSDDMIRMLPKTAGEQFIAAVWKIALVLFLGWLWFHNVAEPHEMTLASEFGEAVVGAVTGTVVLGGLVLFLGIFSGLTKTVE